MSAPVSILNLRGDPFRERVVNHPEFLLISMVGSCAWTTPMNSSSSSSSVDCSHWLLHSAHWLIVSLFGAVPADCPLKLLSYFKGGFFRLSESAETWSMMVNTSSSVKKSTREARMSLWKGEIHLNTAVLAILSQKYWWEGVEAMLTKHGLQLRFGRV